MYCISLLNNHSHSVDASSPSKIKLSSKSSSTFQIQLSLYGLPRRSIKCFQEIRRPYVSNVLKIDRNCCMNTPHDRAETISIIQTKLDLEFSLYEYRYIKISFLDLYITSQENTRTYRHNIDDIFIIVFFNCSSVNSCIIYFILCRVRCFPLALNKNEKLSSIFLFSHCVRLQQNVFEFK